MNKVTFNKPVLICFYGYPGSGKSYVARNLEQVLQVARVSADHIRHELFSRPRYDAQENAIVAHLMNYMTEEFLKAGVGVIYDTNVVRAAYRRRLHELAKKHHSEYLLIWPQINAENAFARTQRRDRRLLDDKYSEKQTKDTFERRMALMQNPQANENYMVISGKHSFASQKNAILSRLYQMGIASAGMVQAHVAKPELVNLVPNLYVNREGISQRNINVT